MASLLDSPCRILPALVTPLTPEGKLDEKSVERLVNHLYQKGVGGLYVTGSTGEGIYLDPAIRRQIVEQTVALSRGRGQVIVHVGAIQATIAYELAEHAGKAGAEAVSSIPPFAGGYSLAEIETFYRELARRSPLPVIGYYIPGLTGQTRSAEQLAAIAAIPNVTGFKFTDTNLYVMQRLASRFQPGQILYNGADEMLSLGLQMGAHGGIGTTYNFMPELFVQIARLCQAGDFAGAINVQKQANVAIEHLLRYHWLAATKQILYWQGLIDHTTAGSPRGSLTADEQRTFRAQLSETVLGPTLVR